jgi:diguanylate cyclase (GGDEF)-like protein
MAAAMEDGISREAEAHLQHKGGHRVTVSVRATPLRDSAGQIVGCAQLFTDLRASRPLLPRPRERDTLLLVDPLTRLSNRTHLEAEIDARLHEMNRYGISFGLIFLDIDRFRDFNYRFGHALGDRMLKTVADTLGSCARPYDVFGRWGGEEFLGIIRNVRAEDLVRVAHRCRALVESSTVMAQQVTVSVGATLATPGDTPDSLVSRVEELTMLCKDEGRNRAGGDPPHVRFRPEQLTDDD